MTDSRSTAPQPAVLVADSNELIRARLRDWLAQEFPHCRCVEATTFDEARNLASTEFPDAALVSIDIPDAKGFEILRMLRTEAPAAPLVAYSAYHADFYRDYALGAGAAACVSPHALDGTMHRLVDALLARGPPPGPAP